MEKIKYVLPLNKIKIDDTRIYYCPKCGGNVEIYIKSNNKNKIVDESSKIYECQNCFHTGHKEVIFKKNIYTELYDKMQSWTKDKRNKKLKKYKEKLKKEKEQTGYDMETYGNRLGNDIFGEINELKTKIKIINNINKNK